jgi:three-Cys-motif partner protein
MPKDSDPEKWDYPPHTKAKHDILSSYLDGWYPIMSKYNSRVLFLDGFAGRGRYNNGEEGSPIIALKRLLDHHRFEYMADSDFVFMFVEANRENARSLSDEIDDFKSGRRWPRNVVTHVINKPFDTTATEIIAYLEEQKAYLAPTFAFVDPFGYTGMPMDLLTDLLDHPRTELFVNFMAGWVHRFITRDHQEKPMRELFGMDVEEVLADFDGTDRVEHIRQVYGRQLQEKAGFDHVQSFEMKNKTGNTGYFMYHGTRHQLGVKLMKAAMWKVDPGGGYVFSDRLADNDVLFVAEPDLRPLRAALLALFPRRSVASIDEIEWSTLLYTPYRETHVRSVLKPLESEGQITVSRPGKWGFPKGTVITFN